MATSSWIPEEAPQARVAPDVVDCILCRSERGIVQRPRAHLIYRFRRDRRGGDANLAAPLQGLRPLKLFRPYPPAVLPNKGGVVPF